MADTQPTTQNEPSAPLKELASQTSGTSGIDATTAALSSIATAIQETASQLISGDTAPTTNGVNGASLATKTDDIPLFPASLMSSEVASQLPEGYTIRPLCKSDYHKGIPHTLGSLPHHHHPIHPH